MNIAIYIKKISRVYYTEKNSLFWKVKILLNDIIIFNFIFYSKIFFWIFRMGDWLVITYNFQKYLSFDELQRIPSTGVLVNLYNTRSKFDFA